MTSPNDNRSSSLEVLRHLALERISPQWRDFLGLLSDALSAQLSPEEYRQFLHQLGVGFAQRHAVGAAVALSDLEQACNEVWGAMAWGYVHVQDDGVTLRMEHRACPLPAALQVDADVAGGFLEGVYATWLTQVGAPGQLKLRQLPSDGQPLSMVFELFAA